MLARSERGLDHPEPLDLVLLVDEQLDARSDLAHRHGVRVEASLDPAAILGDRQLVERLVSNVLDNAILHNEPDGFVEVRTTLDGEDPTGGRHAVISIVNGGEVIPAAEVSRLLEPFQRSGARTAKREGAGVGLSIVRAIAIAHHAELTVTARPDGGLRVEVRFPALGSTASTASPAR